MIKQGCYLRNILMIYYFAITQKFSQIVFEYESLANFAGNTKNTK